MSYALRSPAEVRGRGAFETRSPFDELQLLNEHRSVITRAVPVQNFVFVAQEVDASREEKDQATPGRPIIRFSA